MKTLLFIASLVGVVIGVGYLSSHLSCAKSHTETQVENPPSLVIGGGKNSGGIGLPLGNGKLVEVTVCDDYMWVK